MIAECDVCGEMGQIESTGECFYCAIWAIQPTLVEYLMNNYWLPMITLFS